ncbi:hypothetical protein [Shewanella waksmanii]|uniref:hypothetical protein n=1 Tax=Shewanella waksmanii TaxID=213783 RepID=UPI00373649CC
MHTLALPIFAETDNSLPLASATAQQHFFHKVVFGGNLTMAVAISGLLLCILSGYTFANHFSLMTQVFSHIALILFATAIKVGYVIRCIGLDGLGYRQL